MEPLPTLKQAIYDYIDGQIASQDHLDETSAALQVIGEFYDILTEDQAVTWFYERVAESSEDDACALLGEQIGSELIDRYYQLRKCLY